MNIYNPIIGNVKKAEHIEELIETFKKDGTIIENKEFSKIEEFELNAEEVEFEKCIFSNCKISGNLEKSVFHDVLFENCDFSNCLFSEGSFIRVSIKNSKFIGCNFADSRIYHFSSIETLFKYANFSNTNLEEMIFEECDLSNASFGECKIKNLYFEKSKLIETQFFRTKLKNLDFSTCQLEGIVVDPKDLEGLTVNSFQAIELSKLLGIIIK